MTALAALIGAIASGLATIFAAGNIGLNVSLVCLTLSLTLNYVLIRAGTKILPLLIDLKVVLTELRDRLDHV